jgi:hypothetical protein
MGFERKVASSPLIRKVDNQAMSAQLRSHFSKRFRNYPAVVLTLRGRPVLYA